MSTEREAELDSCGCCGEEALVPGLYNRPGLAQLDYRIGDFQQFLQHMLAQLPQQAVADELQADVFTRPLAQLATRASDDPSIGLLDAWAATLDVLSFYQERIANEGFLRTADERRSLLELARAIGYELKPGVAASTYLAFTVEDKDDPFRTAEVKAGTQVLSIPDKGQLPQTFETIENIEARAQWNALLPRMGLDQNLALKSDDRKLYLIDVDGSLDLGEAALTIELDTSGGHTAETEFYPLSTELDLRSLLNDDDRVSAITALEVDQVYFQGTATQLKAGNYLICVGKNSAGTVMAEPFPVVSLQEDSLHQFTVVTLSATPVRSGFTPVFKLPRLKEARPKLETLGFNQATVGSRLLKFKWTQSNLGVLLKMNQWSSTQLKLLLQQPRKIEPGIVETGIFVLRQQVSFFGHNAPRHATLPKPDNTRGGAGTGDPYSSSWDSTSPTIWEDSQNHDLPDGVHAYLERHVEEVQPDSWVVVEAPCARKVYRKVYRVASAHEESRVDYALSGKTTALSFNTPDGTPISGGDKSRCFRFRTTSAYVQSEALTLTEIPVANDVEEDSTELMLNELILDLRIGQAVSISGERQDAPGVHVTEVKTLKEITHYAGYTVLEFDSGLTYTYLRKSIKVNANVAEATHGETVEEILGNGNAAQTNQRFELRKPPLTYVSATTPSGAESTLTVRANGIEWKEVDALFQQQANSECYSVQRDNDAVPTLTFGDGIHGARLPSGELNVTAVYRTGIGPDGEVPAGSLSLLKKRPPGVTAVTNPVAASGAEAPETRDKARQNAPQTVRTLDRIVSLNDFEDFAATFAGVGKAQAVPVWTGASFTVHVTIASASGKELAEGDALFGKLEKAMDKVRDSTVAYEVASFKQLFFNLSANLKIDRRYLFADVKKKVIEVLEKAFGFAQRQFAQPITAAEVTALVQAVEGVVYVDLDDLYMVAADGTAPTATWSSVLAALPARWDDGEKEIKPAQLLLLNPAGIVLMEISDE